MRRLILAAVAASLCLSTAAIAQDAPVNPVRLNQAGLLANGPKQALLPDAATRPLRWRLLDAAGTVLAQGSTTVLGDDAASGQHLHLLDFSSAKATGDGFTLAVGDGAVGDGAVSRPVGIGDGPYAGLKRDALAYFYHNRSGLPIEARLVGEAWARPAGHPKDVAPCFNGKDKAGNVWPGCSYSLDVTGGWYDAGDQGKYVVNGGIAVWTLLNLYERQVVRHKPPALPDGTAILPEAGNGVNDLLDEARWEMEFLLSMQVPDGTRMGLPLGPQKGSDRLTFTDVDVSGMAHHKMGDEHWTGFPMPPHLDPERRFLYAPNTAATLNLAATAAQAARIWQKIDPTFSDRCLKAALRAWAAAVRVSDARAIGDFNGSGGYADDDVSDEFFWAAAELLVTTHQPLFAKVVTGSQHFQRDAVADPGWGQTAPLGVLSLVLHPDALPDRDGARLVKSITRAADNHLREGGDGYRQPMPARAFGWGSNGGLLNRAIVLAYAHDLTGEGKYRDKVIDVASYLLGRNPLDFSYISGYGARSMQHPHHRFWAPSLDPKLPPPPPGVLSGGPNGNPGEDARKLLGDCAPQACWRDDLNLFTLNEVAINWNAPLVWVAAYLDER